MKIVIKDTKGEKINSFYPAYPDVVKPQKGHFVQTNKGSFEIRFVAWKFVNSDTELHLICKEAEPLRFLKEEEKWVHGGYDMIDHEYEELPEEWVLDYLDDKGFVKIETIEKRCPHENVLPALNVLFKKGWLEQEGDKYRLRRI